MIKVTYIVSLVDQSFFLESTFRLMDKSRFQLSVILLNPGSSKLEEVLKEENIPFVSVPFRASKKDYPMAFIRCLRFLRKKKPDIVHAHLNDAGFIGLSAAKLAGVKTRVFTRHGGSQREFSKKGYRQDKIINRLTTHIVATCENVKEILIDEDGISPEDITIVNLAFDKARFGQPHPEVLEKLEKKYNPNNRKPVIGVISRWIEWKGIQYILPAFQKVLEKYPDALLVLANTSGDYKAEITSLVDKFQPGQITLVPFEKNFYELYHLFDIFVHAPTGKRFEAFGQIYIESLAAGIPSVFTMTGIAPEFIIDEYNALVVPYRDPQAIFQAIDRLMNDSDLANRLIVQGKQSIENKFGIEQSMEVTELLYTNLYAKRK